MIACDPRRQRTSGTGRYFPPLRRWLPAITRAVIWTVKGHAPYWNMSNRCAWRSCRAMRPMRLLSALLIIHAAIGIALKAKRWQRNNGLMIAKQQLLGCSYFHLVFTLPHDLNPIILSNKKTALNILFAAVNQTLQAFAKDPQWRLEGRLGFISVLHTWSQTLIDHFHLHCLIPAGALSFTKDRCDTGPMIIILFKITSLASGV